MTVRYLAFAGDEHYPIGGILDLDATADEHSLNALIERLKASNSDWFHILDISSMKLVAVYQSSQSGKSHNHRNMLAPDCLTFTYKNSEWNAAVIVTPRPIRQKQYESL